MIAGLVLALALLSTAGAQVSFKIYVSKTRAKCHITAALSMFVLAQIGFFFALTELDVGLVYMSTGLTHVTVLLLSYFVLEEPITRHHWMAVALICGGLGLYA